MGELAYNNWCYIYTQSIKKKQKKTQFKKHRQEATRKNKKD
jgi:hypothetical protein